MEGYLLNATPVPENQLQQTITQMFGTNITTVNQPWHSHGEMLEVQPLIYFKGDLSNPQSMCGNDSLVMSVASMSLAGRCVKDNALSYLLIPDSSDDNT